MRISRGSAVVARTETPATTAAAHTLPTGRNSQGTGPVVEGSCSVMARYYIDNACLSQSMTG